VLAILATGTFMAGAAALQTRRDHAYPVRAVNESALYLTSGSALRRLSIGYSALAADVYWIRAIQYFGDRRLKREAAASGGGYALLYQLLDLTTTLDPRFNIAYRFGAIFLGEPFPGGAGRPEQAIALLEKGLSAVPGKWEYAMDIGFVHYWWLHDYKAAAGWFDRASHLPGAPWWLNSMAATTLAQGGDRASSRRMWESIHESADNDWLRGSSERALRQLQALDDIDQLQAALDRAAKESGITPGASRAIRLNGKIIVDPTGVPYEIDASGRVHLGQTSALFPLPAQPIVPVSDAK
jgi:hypothetical protein